MNSILYSKDLISILEDGLFYPGIGIEKAYKQLDEYRDRQRMEVDFVISKFELNSPFRSQVTLDSPTTTHAIDLPIYLRNDFAELRLMVLAMDSLPPEPESIHWQKREINLQTEICFWAPFSLIDDWNHPVGSMKSNLSFFKPLVSQFSVYVTDIYKLFYRKIEAHGFVLSNQIRSYTHLEDKVHFEILKREIDLVKPTAIIVLGKAALEALSTILLPNKGLIFPEYQITNFPCRVLALPHISGAANGAKSKFVKRPEFDFIQADSWNGKMALMALHQLGFWL